MKAVVLRSLLLGKGGVSPTCGPLCREELRVEVEGC